MPRIRATRLTAIASAVRRLVESVFAGAAAAYSVRIPVGSTYSGPLLRVRRSSDSAEQDISALVVADANGNRWLDEQALTLFCGAPKYPLDAVSGAAAAFALRLLRVGYTGPCIRVRRSFDNAEQDIGFTAAGDLDTVALLAFVQHGGPGPGNQDGFVVTWYDQSGNGWHVSNTVGAAQPRIVNAGVVETLNGRPIVQFAGAGSLVAASPVTALHGFIVQNTTASTTQVEYVTGPSGIIALRTSATQRRVGAIGANNNFTDSVSAGTLRQYTDSASGNSMRRNGTGSGTTGGSNSTGSANLEIGGRNGLLLFNGGVSELILFSAQVSDGNRLIVEQSQTAYYGITYASTIPSAFVTTWYDQSGNARHVAQSTAAAQPRIVNGGVLNRKNGQPSVFFSGSSWLIASAALGAQQAFMVQATNSTAFSFEYSCGSIVPSLAAIRSDASFRRAGRAGTTNQLGQFIDPADLGVLRQYTDAIEPSGSAMRRNGNDVARDSVVSSTQGSLLTIGSRDGVTASIVADISEIVFFNALLSTPARQALERSQGAAFGITVA